jgi:hypothetical protein
LKRRSAVSKKIVPAVSEVHGFSLASGLMMSGVIE